MIIRQDFFFNDTAPTEIYTLSLHDALPIFDAVGHLVRVDPGQLRLEPPEFRTAAVGQPGVDCRQDRKSTRLNSSNSQTQYAAFCLKKMLPHSDSSLSAVFTTSS